MAQNQPQFYMVWCENSNTSVVKHESVWLAQCEAERLAALNPGRSFYILKAIKVSKVAAVITEELQPKLQSSARWDGDYKG